MAELSATGSKSRQATRPGAPPEAALLELPHGPRSTSASSTSARAFAFLTAMAVASGVAIALASGVVTAPPPAYAQTRHGAAPAFNGEACDLVGPAALQAYFGSPDEPRTSLPNGPRGSISNCEWTASSDQLALLIFTRSGTGLTSYFDAGARPQATSIGGHAAAVSRSGGADGAAQVAILDGRVYVLANTVPSARDVGALESVARLVIAAVKA